MVDVWCGLVCALPQIPVLGKHYSQRWAQEDLLEEQREGARANDKKKSVMGGPLSELDAKGEPESTLCPLDNTLLHAPLKWTDGLSEGVCLGMLRQRMFNADLRRFYPKQQINFDR